MVHSGKIIFVVVWLGLMMLASLLQWLLRGRKRGADHNETPWHMIVLWVGMVLFFLYALSTIRFL